MKPKDFEKYRMQRPEGQSSTVEAEDRMTIEEAQRLRDDFARSFPLLEEKLKELRAEAFRGKGRYPKV